MTLGMISWIREEDFQRVKAKGLSFVELDVNDRVKEFLDALEQTKEYSKKYDLPVAAIGRWGSARICLLYTSPSPRDRTRSRMPSSA